MGPLPNHVDDGVFRIQGSVILLRVMAMAAISGMTNHPPFIQLLHDNVILLQQLTPPPQVVAAAHHSSNASALN